MDKIIIDSASWSNVRFRLGQVLLQKSILNNNEFKVKEPYEKLIYHYTSIDTFKAIIKSQCIHATNILYVKDSTELNYAQKLFIKNIKILFNERKSLIEKSILTRLLSMFENIEKSNRFITCFSINGDLKHQWEQYGNNGYGVSIGFDPHKLKETLDPITSVYHIIYNKKEQEKLIISALKNTLDFFIERYNLFDWNDFDPIYLIAKVIYEYCELYLCQFKDKSYKAEKEFRFEIKTDSFPNYPPFRIEFKEKNIPFISNKTDFQRRIEKYINKAGYDYEYNIDFEYQMKRLPIEEVFIGYNLDFSERKMELSEFLKSYKYLNVDFRNSIYMKLLK